MKKTTIFHCTSFSDAQDRANMYYIESPTAISIRREGYTFEVCNKAGRALAIFAYRLPMF